MQVKLWVCPCGNYYGSSSQANLDLRQEKVLGRVEDRTPDGKRLEKGVRANCPDCGAERRPVLITVDPGLVPGQLVQA